MTYIKKIVLSGDDGKCSVELSTGDLLAFSDIIVQPQPEVGFRKVLIEVDLLPDDFTEAE